MGKVHVVSTRMVDIDYDIYRAKVEQSGLSPAEFNRQALLTSTVKQKVPKELVDGIKQLGRIGNNLNQIAHKANAAGCNAVEASANKAIALVIELFTNLKTLIK